MDGEENLKPFTSETAKENGRKGGIASGEARREKKKLKECLEVLLEKEFTDRATGQTMTGAEGIALMVFQKALKGDLKAFELVRDTSGQKPVDKVITSDVDPSVIDEVERMVNGD